MFPFPRVLWLCMIFLIGLGLAADVPFVFSDNLADVARLTSAQLDQASADSPDLVGVPAVSTPSDDDVLQFPVLGGRDLSGGLIEEMAGDLIKVFDERVDADNQYVLDEAAVLAAKYPGDLTVDQICSIYDYLKYGDDSKKGWSYVRDPRGPDFYRYANESLKIG